VKTADICNLEIQSISYIKILVIERMRPDNKTGNSYGIRGTEHGYSYYLFTDPGFINGLYE
jgi:hypothetical protein